MAIQNFIATVWSARLLENLHKSLVYGKLVNTDYEGEIKGKGSTVNINSVGAVTIGDYDKTNGIGDPEELTDSQKKLTIDQSKFFNFRVDDVDKAQSNANIMNGAMREAAYGLGNVMDQYIASLYTGVASDNAIGSDSSPIVPTKDNAYDYLVDLGVKLDEANVPDLDRFVVVPAWFHGLIQKDARFTKDPAVLATGAIGQVDNMTVYKSNNVPSSVNATSGATEKYKIMAGYKGAISFASAIDETKAYRPEKFFADAVKGLSVYGAKLVRPSGISVLTANKS